MNGEAANRVVQSVLPAQALQRQSGPPTFLPTPAWTVAVIAALLPAMLAAQTKDTSAANAVGAAAQKLDKCTTTVGAIRIAEPESQLLFALRRYQLGSPTVLIATMIQASNCFVVKEPADFVLTPNVLFEEKRQSGFGAAVGRIAVGMTPAGILSPNLKF